MGGAARYHSLLAAFALLGLSLIGGCNSCAEGAERACVKRFCNLPDAVVTDPDVWFSVPAWAVKNANCQTVIGMLRAADAADGDWTVIDRVAKAHGVASCPAGEMIAREQQSRRVGHRPPDFSFEIVRGDADSKIAGVINVLREQCTSIGGFGGAIRLSARERSAVSPAYEGVGGLLEQTRDGTLFIDHRIPDLEAHLREYKDAGLTIEFWVPRSR